MYELSLVDLVHGSQSPELLRAAEAMLYDTPSEELRRQLGISQLQLEHATRTENWPGGAASPLTTPTVQLLLASSHSSNGDEGSKPIKIIRLITHGTASPGSGTHAESSPWPPPPQSTTDWSDTMPGPSHGYGLPMSGGDKQVYKQAFPTEAVNQGHRCCLGARANSPAIVWQQLIEAAKVQQLLRTDPEYRDVVIEVILTEATRPYPLLDEKTGRFMTQERYHERDQAFRESLEKRGLAVDMPTRQHMDGPDAQPYNYKILRVTADSPVLLNRMLTTPFTAAQRGYLYPWPTLEDLGVPQEVADAFEVMTPAEFERYVTHAAEEAGNKIAIHNIACVDARTRMQERLAQQMGLSLAELDYVIGQRSGFEFVANWVREVFLRSQQHINIKGGAADAQHLEFAAHYVDADAPREQRIADVAFSLDSFMPASIIYSGLGGLARESHEMRLSLPRKAVSSAYPHLFNSWAQLIGTLHHAQRSELFERGLMGLPNYLIRRTEDAYQRIKLPRHHFTAVAHPSIADTVGRMSSHWSPQFYIQSSADRGVVPGRVPVVTLEAPAGAHR